MSSILDMALASAECAAALEHDIVGSKDAITSATQFFDEVRHNIVGTDLHCPVRAINLGDTSPASWLAQHTKYLARADEVAKCLAPFSGPSRRQCFNDWFGRLTQKIIDARRLEASL